MASIRKHRSKWQVQVRRVGHRPVTRTFVLKSDAMAWSRQVEQQIDKGDMVGNLGLLKALALGELLER